MAAEDTFHHVRDFPYFELPNFLGGPSSPLPVISLGFYDLHLTKFMVLQVVAGALITIIFFGLSRHIANGRPARGAFWNFWETLAVFIRDNVVRPAIGVGHHHHDDEEHGHASEDGHAHPEHGHGKKDHHEEDITTTGFHPADKYLPFVWTCFFYVLFCNLLGAFPFLGSATGHIAVTGALALAVFIKVVLSGSNELGFGGFVAALAPSGLPGFVIPLIWVIEVIGLLIKHGVLAVRLFANIMAGHTVIAVILSFIAVSAAPENPGWLFYLVAPGSIFGQIGVGLLELFVAFLQAYLFAFLTSLFIGTAVHPH